MIKGKVVTDLHLDHVRIEMGEASDELLKAAAFRVVERAGLRIRENDQIDTSFMVNSVYAKWRKGSGYTAAKNEAETHTTGRSGHLVSIKERMAPDVALPADTTGERFSAAAVVGANYAIYQEADNPFLWPAGEATANEMGAIARKVYKEPQEAPNA